MSIKSFLKSSLFLFAFLSAAGLSANNGLTDPHNKEDKIAEFPGGKLALQNFIQENFSYPDLADYYDIEGIVVIEFEVTETGSLQSFSVTQKLGGGCDEAALTLLKKMPDWMPKKQRGKAVKSKIALPIKFEID